MRMFRGVASLPWPQVAGVLFDECNPVLFTGIGCPRIRQKELRGLEARISFRLKHAQLLSLSMMEIIPDCPRSGLSLSRTVLVLDCPRPGLTSSIKEIVLELPG